MKGLLLFGVAFLLFFPPLLGFDGKNGIEVVSTELQSAGHDAKFNAVSFPFDPQVVIPEQQLTVNDQNPPDPEKNSKTLLSKVSGPDLLINFYSLQQGKRDSRLGLHALRFILFRNLRL